MKNGNVNWDSSSHQQGVETKASSSSSLDLFAPGLLLKSATWFRGWTDFSQQLILSRKYRTDLPDEWLTVHQILSGDRQDRQSVSLCTWMGRSRVVFDSSYWADISNRKCTHQLVLENCVWEKWVPEMSALISCRASLAKACRNTNGRAVLSSQKGQQIDPLFLYFFHMWKKKCVFSVIAVSIWGFLSLASDLLGTLKGEHLCVCFAPFC